MNKSDLLFLLPAYNEETTLTSIIQQLDGIFSRDQIILADDGSTDNTTNIARQMGVKIIRNRNNKGKGHVLRKAFTNIINNHPKIKWIMTIDTDGQHDLKDIPKFFKTIDRSPNVEIIIGKRKYCQMPSGNRISNRLTSKWSNYWLNWNLDDLQCGFRCYKTDALRIILEYGLTKNKFELETEILFVAWLLNIKIIDIPITTLYPRNRRKSRVSPIIDTIRWILLILKFSFSRRFINQIWQKRYLRRL